jgi:hypothetical protein
MAASVEEGVSVRGSATGHSSGRVQVTPETGIPAGGIGAISLI